MERRGNLSYYARRGYEVAAFVTSLALAACSGATAPEARSAATPLAPAAAAKPSAGQRPEAAPKPEAANGEKVAQEFKATVTALERDKNELRATVVALAQRPVTPPKLEQPPAIPSPAAAAKPAAGGGIFHPPNPDRPDPDNPNGCSDGDQIYNHPLILGPDGKRALYGRKDMGRAERATSIEISWPGGKGLGGFDRVVLVARRQGRVWKLHATEGTTTAHEVAWCGSPEEVEKEVDRAVVTSFRQSSRDPNGIEPPEAEIGVHSLTYEGGQLRTKRPGTLSCESLATRLQITFVEGGKNRPQPVNCVR